MRDMGVSAKSVNRCLMGMITLAGNALWRGWGIDCRVEGMLTFNDAVQRQGGFLVGGRGAHVEAEYRAVRGNAEQPIGYIPCIPNFDPRSSFSASTYLKIDMMS